MLHDVLVCVSPEPQRRPGSRWEAEGIGGTGVPRARSDAARRDAHPPLYPTPDRNETIPPYRAFLLTKYRQRVGGTAGDSGERDCFGLRELLSFT